MIGICLSKSGGGGVHRRIMGSGPIVCVNHTVYTRSAAAILALSSRVSSMQQNRSTFNADTLPGSEISCCSI